METAFILRGRLSDSTHIELDEPVTGIDGEVEVVVRRVGPQSAETVDVFEWIAACVPGSRSKEEIDRQIGDEHGSLGDR